MLLLRVPPFQFPVIWDGQDRTYPLFRQNHMATRLSHEPPAISLKRPDGLPAENSGQPLHLCRDRDQHVNHRSLNRQSKSVFMPSL